MKGFGNVSTVRKAIPDLLLAVPAELVLFKCIANCFGRLAVKGDLQRSTLNIIRNGKPIGVSFSYGSLCLSGIFDGLSFNFLGFSFNCSFNFFRFGNSCRGRT